MIELRLGPAIPLLDTATALGMLRPYVTECVQLDDALSEWERGAGYEVGRLDGRRFQGCGRRVAYMCNCDGALHGIHCTWITVWDDGRDQALDDPEIDEPTRQAWRDHPWPPITTS